MVIGVGNTFSSDFYDNSFNNNFMEKRITRWNFVDNNGNNSNVYNRNRLDYYPTNNNNWRAEYSGGKDG